MSAVRWLCFATLLFHRLLLGQAWFATGQSADLLLSGVGFNNAGGALLFNHPSGIASDGTRFLLCDRFNNRVLVWNTLPIAWNQQPDLVLGQLTFTGNNSGTSMSELNFPGNVSVASNGVVTIADTDNDRILIWKTFPTRNGQPANISIDLPSITPQGVAMRNAWPWGVWTNGTRLAAVATHGSTILFWNSLPSRDNQPPDYSVTHQHFGTPRNISTDGSSYFFVGDHNSKVTGDKPGTFFWNSYPTQANQTYDFYREGDWIKGVKLPDGRLVAGGLGSVYIWSSMPTSATQQPVLTVTNPYYKNGDGPDVVFAAGRLYVNNYNGTNVHVYNSVPTLPTQNPDFTLGSSSVSVNMLDSLWYIQNPVVATDGMKLVVSSDFDGSLSIWRALPTKSGTAPDIKRSVRVQGIDISPWDNALSQNRLVLAGKKKVVVWNNIPLNGEAPSAVFTDRLGSFQFEELKGVALDSMFLYLSERSGRIGIWRGIPSSSSVEPIITFTLPATNLNQLHSDGVYFTATVQDGSPRGVYIYRVADLKEGVVPVSYKVVLSSPQLQLNLPSSAVTFGNSLAIANTSFNSVLVWRSVEDAGDPSKVVVLGQQSPSGQAPAIAANRLHMPGSLAGFGGSLWVGEFKFSSRILRYSIPQATGVAGFEPTPRTPVLHQNFPNPFNAVTQVRFELTTAGVIRLSVFDLLGREVASLVNGVLSAGEHRVCWNGRNAAGEMLPTGAYISVLRTDGVAVVRKMLLLK